MAAKQEEENANSKSNQFVAKVLENANMTEEEKQRLLRNQEDNLESIKSILDKDKQAQEQEFDKILKERLDRRRRLREKEKAKELAEQTKE